MLEHHAAQSFHHGDVATAQGLLLQLVESRAELAEDLLNALQEALTLRLQALGLGPLGLLIGQPQAGCGEQQQREATGQ